MLKMAFAYFFHHETIKEEYREIVRDKYTSRQITEADLEEDKK